MSDRLLVSTRKGLFFFQSVGRGGPWMIAQTAFLGDNVTLVGSDPRDGTLLAALNHGHFGVKLQRSRDGGQTWAECGAPQYPEKPADYPDHVNPMTTQPIPWALKIIWSLEPGGGNQSGVWWCGTAPGGLFRSEDGGDTWSLNRPLWDDPRRREWFGGGLDWPAIHSICVDPRDAKRVTLGVSCGGVWQTSDAGQTWDCRAGGMFADYMPPEGRENPNIQDPHRVVRCPAQPDVLWAQHHNGVFRTTSDCERWDNVPNVTPSVFGFAVAVHPRDGNTAWFAPAIKDERRIPVEGRVVISRTRDGGKSFEELRHGLPQEHAYDLVFRHALDIDETGDRLAFGSTTGNVWLTDDQGDRWQGIATHLPPVHAVRFF